MPRFQSPIRPKKPFDESLRMRIADAFCVGGLGLLSLLFTFCIDTGMTEEGLGYYRFFSSGLIVLGSALIFVEPPE